MDLLRISTEIKSLANEDRGLPFQGPLLGASKVAEDLSTVAENPMASVLDTLLKNGSTVVIQDSFFRPLVLDWLSSRFPTLSTSVITFREIAEQSEVPHLIFIGSPQFVAFRLFQESDYRFAIDPKSYDNDFIMYPFGDSKLNIKGMVNDGQPIREITSTQPMVALHITDELDGESEWKSVEKAAKSAHHTDKDTEISARFLGLAGNHHVFIEDDQQSRVFILAKDSEGRLDVHRIGVNDLRTNNYLLLRTQGASSDLITEIANELGAKKLRPSQRRYKELLRAKVKEFGGVTPVRLKLEREYGLVTSRIPDWAFNDRRIGPGSKENFEKLCEFLDLKDEAPKLWGHLEQIRSLHISAGNEAMERLKTAIREVAPDDKYLKEVGYITRSVRGCGEIGLYRVEHIGEAQMVSVYEIEILRVTSEARS
jgi:hypothetical protein